VSNVKGGPKMKVQVLFSAPVYITEDPEKVRQAVSNIINHGRPKSEEIRPMVFSDANQKSENSGGETENINPFISDATSRPNIQQIIVSKGDLMLLAGIHYMIRKEEIIDTAKSAFMECLSEDGLKTAVLLNKQAAFMKRLSFPADSEPLGSVKLEIRAETSEDMLKLIDWLTPPTKNGLPVFELKLDEL